MKNLIANKSFVYSGAPDEIKQWLKGQGYITEDIYDEYQNNKAVAFKIVGTSIKIGYHNPVNTYDTGKPKVHLLSGPHLVSTNPEAAERGLELYPKLYRKFREQRKRQ